MYLASKIDTPDSDISQVPGMKEYTQLIRERKKTEQLEINLGIRLEQLEKEKESVAEELVLAKKTKLELKDKVASAYENLGKLNNDNDNTARTEE